MEYPSDIGIVPVLALFPIIGLVMHYIQKKVELVEPSTGIVKKIPLGFSWITLTVGFLLPIYRADGKGVVQYIMVILFSLLVGEYVVGRGSHIPPLGHMVTVFLFAAGTIGVAFTYNKNYIWRLIQENNYIPKNDFSKKLLLQKNIEIDKIRLYY